MNDATTTLTVRVDFLSDYGNRGTEHGTGATVDDAIADALSHLLGPADEHNELHGWTMDARCAA